MIPSPMALSTGAASTVLDAPVNSAVGLGIMLAGLPVYALWRRRAG